MVATHDATYRIRRSATRKFEGATSGVVRLGEYVTFITRAVLAIPFVIAFVAMRETPASAPAGAAPAQPDLCGAGARRVGIVWSPSRGDEVRAAFARSGVEMQGDAALSESVRRGYLPETTLTGAANLLVLPNLDAANILFNVLKVTSGHGVTVGPMLLGAAKPVHILTPSATMRRVVNMTALAVADAAELR